MKQNGKKGRMRIVAALILAVAIGFAVSNGNLGSSEALSGEQIRRTLENCGAADGVYVENVPGTDFPDGTPSSERYDRYHSEATGYDYYFHSDSGRLWKVKAPEGRDRAVEAVPEALWQQRVLEAVSMYLGDAQIGALEFESAYENGGWCTSNVVETYQGMETGTTAFVQCLPDGRVLTCQLRYGSIFTDDSDPGELLGEEKACAMALEALKKDLDGMTVQETTCELKAVEDTRYYQVTMTIQTEPYVIAFYARLDAYTGALLDSYRTV